MQIPEIPNYNEWLKSLTVGKQVAVEMFADGETTKYEIREIIKIEDDIIEVRGFNRFKNGMVSTYEGHLTRICPITPEALDMSDRKRLLKLLYGFDARNYPTEKLRKIYEIIKDSEK